MSSLLLFSRSFPPDLYSFAVNSRQLFFHTPFLPFLRAEYLGGSTPHAQCPCSFLSTILISFLRLIWFGIIRQNHGL